MTAPPGDRREGADSLVADLFTNGCGQAALRLVLTDMGGRDLGGWCRGAVRDRIEPALSRARREGAAEALERMSDQLAANAGSANRRALGDPRRAACVGLYEAAFIVNHEVAALRSALAAGQEEAG